VNTSPRKTVDELLGDWADIDRAMRAGLREARLRHKRLGRPIVVWRDGQVVEIPPEKIDVGETAGAPAGAKPTSPEAA
jgi:hypothetical protein